MKETDKKLKSGPEQSKAIFKEDTSNEERKNDFAEQL